MNGISDYLNDTHDTCRKSNDTHDIRGEYKDDLFIAFIDKMFELYNKRETDEILRILLNKNLDDKPIYRYHNSIIRTYTNNTEDETVVVRLWTDKKTKEFLDALHYICSTQDVIISLNNRMLEMWSYIMNTEMKKFFLKGERIDCSRDHYLTLKVRKQLWADFIKKCKLLSITASEGFKSCVDEFLLNEARIYL